MIAYSIDVETTGIDPETTQILSLGIAEFDTITGLTGRNLHFLFPHEQITGTPYALHMNADLIEVNRNYFLAEDKNYVIEQNGFDAAAVLIDGQYYLKDFKIADVPCKTPLDKFFSKFVEYKTNVIALGKNFGSFDLQFLKKIGLFNDVKLSSRSLDPSVLFMKDSDVMPPSLDECMRRDGWADTIVKHDALQDAKDTAELFCSGLKRLKNN